MVDHDHGEPDTDYLPVLRAMLPPTFNRKLGFLDKKTWIAVWLEDVLLYGKRQTHFTLAERRETREKHMRIILENAFDYREQDIVNSTFGRTITKVIHDAPECLHGIAQKLGVKPSDAFWDTIGVPAEKRQVPDGYKMTFAKIGEGIRAVLGCRTTNGSSSVADARALY